MLFKYTTKEHDLLARIMRAEALGEGNEGMLMVGNVVANRVLADCHTFTNIRTLTNAIYQSNQFAGTKGSLFQGTATTHEKNLAKRILNGEYYHPATHSLWFYAPTNKDKCKNTWYEQKFSGRHKGHCFYVPDPKVCISIR